MQSLNQDLKLALQISWNMGQIALDLIDSKQTSYKNSSYADPVTEADCQAQAYAEKIIQINFPGDSLIGEENLNVKGLNERCWFIDPIDGTNNYCNNRYGWATSLALVENEQPVLAVIYIPNEKTVFFADQNGAWQATFADDCGPENVDLKTKEKLRIARNKPVQEANVTTWISGRRFQKYENFFRHLLTETSLAYSGVSGAVEMTNISRDCLDGWIQADVKHWDYIPGAFIAQQAGAVLLDVEEYRIVANTVHLAEHLKEIVLRSKNNLQTVTEKIESTI